METMERSRETPVSLAERLTPLEKPPIFQETRPPPPPETTPTALPSFLYPRVGDPEFQANIAERKEFASIPFNNTIYNVEERANELCNVSFETLPHQMFVRHFLSQETPYNSLLLYHGLGTGKTCSAIGVAEEMRYYMKQLNIQKKILVVAFPNVQHNFERQLFDENKMVWSPDTKTWNLDTCVGKQLLKEIDPYLSEKKEVIQLKIKHLINRYYAFTGYIELANMISRLTTPPAVGDATRVIENRIHAEFDNRLVIIDEVHNIRTFEKENNTKIIHLLIYVARVAQNMRLILLSATPIYNSPKEIVTLANLLLANDKRPPINETGLFDRNGDLTTDGAKRIASKLTGYVSFVRGENPYSFPFRIYPQSIPEYSARSILNQPYPTYSIDGVLLDKKINRVDIITTELSAFQQQVYDTFVQHVLTAVDVSAESAASAELSIAGEKKWGYQSLQTLLQALDIVFPSLDDPTVVQLGQDGLNQVVEYDEKEVKFKYIEGAPRIFEKDKIGQYSTKIASILDIVEKSSGVVLIFAEYIWGGIVPLALALEERGFQRYSPPVTNAKMRPRTNLLTSSRGGGAPVYTMITGVTSLSPDNASDVKVLSSQDNKDGNRVKVILISTAGSEGLDFKFIRQIHIMDPWYTMNRLEQIIGRGVRNGSHCALPMAQRNVEIYMHAAVGSARETADLYLYRYAETKAIQIGKVNRILKEISVDCRLNEGQIKMTVADLNQTLQIQLSSSNTIIPYAVGDKPYSVVCDFMEHCEYKCACNRRLVFNEDTYTASYLKYNRVKWMDKIRALYHTTDAVAYSVDHLVRLCDAPRKELEYALQLLAGDPLEYVYDRYGRQGRLLLCGRYAVFQPLELLNDRASLYERQFPVPKRIEHVALTHRVHEKPPASVRRRPTLETIVAELDKCIAWVHADEVAPGVEDKLQQAFQQALIFARDELKISVSILEKAVVEQYLDRSDFDTKQLLLQASLERYDWEKYVHQYFKSKQLEKDRWMVLFNKAAAAAAADIDGVQLLASYDNNGIWEVTPRQTFMAQYGDKKIPAAWEPTPYVNHPVGFMGPSGDDIVFRVVDKKGGRGVYIMNGYNQSKIKQMLVDYATATGDKAVQAALNMDINTIIVLLELLMRIHGECDSPEKTYFKKFIAPAKK
jgi:hypothetical protein